MLTVQEESRVNQLQEFRLGLMETQAGDLRHEEQQAIALAAAAQVAEAAAKATPPGVSESDAAVLKREVSQIKGDNREAARRNQLLKIRIRKV